MKSARGFTMVELMVAIIIGLVVTLATTTMLADAEGRRRTQASLAGVDQSSQFVTRVLDELLRNAGSGFSQSWPYTFGCKLNGTLGTTQLFPLPSLPAPFAGVPAAVGTFRLAPVVILKGASQTGSDVLVISAGAAGFGELPISFGNVPTTTALNLVGTTTLLPNDLLLVADQTNGGAPVPCLLEQVSASFASGPTVTQATLAGDYYLSSGTDRALTDYSADGLALSLGNAVNGNPPSISLIGVGANDLSATSPASTSGSMLYSLNLLAAAAAPVAIADGVIELRALYGVDSDGDGKLDSWQDPATGNYAPAVLLDGSAASAQRLLRIKAIRVGMIVRTSLLEKPDAQSGQPVSPAALSMFADLGTLAYTRSLGSDERNYRYRVVETTIPLRNMLLIAN